MLVRASENIDDVRSRCGGKAVARQDGYAPALRARASASRPSQPI
jgi:hypothetical protein